MADLDPRLHFVVATAMVVKDGKILIAKRHEREIAHPGRWTVPGGKLVVHEYKTLPQVGDNYPQWYGVTEWVLHKEIKEEVGLEIGKPSYVTDLVFIRPDGYPALTLSFWAPWKSGEVVLCKDLVEYAWVTPEEAKSYDLIEGILDEINIVGEILKQQQA
jgi:8-oxo-dGTP pyrophosphatase MutT (NUDIX family)